MPKSPRQRLPSFLSRILRLLCPPDVCGHTSFVARLDPLSPPPAPSGLGWPRCAGRGEGALEPPELPRATHCGIPCDGARLGAAHTRCCRRVRPHSLSPAGPTSSRPFFGGGQCEMIAAAPTLAAAAINGCQRAPPAHAAEHQTVVNETHTKRAVAAVGRSLALTPLPPPTSKTPPPPSIDPCRAPLPI